MKFATCLSAKVVYCLLLVTLSTIVYAQEEGKTSPLGKKGYGSITGLFAIPQAELKEFSKNRGGFALEIGSYFTENSPLSFGGEFSMLLSSSKKDHLLGLEIETSTLYLDLQPYLRWSPARKSSFYPFIDVSAGMALTNTETTSEIVDEPTFIEEVLFGQQTEVDITSHENNTSVGFGYSLGGGLVIAHHLKLGVRYQATSKMNYVDKDAVYVKDSRLVYEKHKIPLDMVIISLGITF